MTDKLKDAATALVEAHKLAVNAAWEDLEFHRSSMESGPDEATGWQHAATTLESLADATACLARLLGAAGAADQYEDLGNWSSYQVNKTNAWSASAEEHAEQIIGGEDPDDTYERSPDAKILREASLSHGRAATAFLRASGP